MRPVRPWEETVAQYGARLKSMCQHVNDSYNADGVCKCFPNRLQALVDAEGGRISTIDL